MSRPPNKEKIEFSQGTESVEPKLESDVQTSKSEPHTTKPKVQTADKGLVITRIEGFLADLQKHVESLPAGEVPVEIVFESQNVRIMGRAVFLLATKKDSTSKSKCITVEAMGLEKLNTKLSEMDLTKFEDVFILSAQVNKRTAMQQYLAILVGE